MAFRDGKSCLLSCGLGRCEIYNLKAHSASFPFLALLTASILKESHIVLMFESCKY